MTTVTTQYFTGRPCKHGHIAMRSVANRTCLECNRLAVLKQYQVRTAEQREQYSLRQKAYVEDNRDLFNAYAKRTRQLRRTRMVPWMEKDRILQIYKDCPAGMQVDHVIPLNGKMVCGLHVANNLQYLTPLANLQKLNKFETDWK